jgi:hypothetical protein
MDRPRSRAVSRTAHPTVAVGLDVGYAMLKVTTNRGDRWLVPTAVAPVDLDLIDLAPPADGTAEAAAGAPFPHTVTLPDGSRYLLGTSAMWSGRRLRDHLVWDQWWQSIPYRVLLQALRTVLPPKPLVVTGLPLHLASLAETRAELAHTCQRLLGAQQVAVLPQGVAAAMALGLHAGTEHLAVIDIGGRTTECVTLTGGHVHMARSMGLRVGVLAAYERVAERYRQRDGWDVDAYLIDQALRGDYPLTRICPGLTLEALKRQLQEALAPLAERIRAACQTLWGDGGQLDRVIVCGGGGALLLDQLTAWRTGLLLAPDAVWLNAQGYLQAAQTVLAAKSQSMGNRTGIGAPAAGAIDADADGHGSRPEP